MMGNRERNGTRVGTSKAEQCVFFQTLSKNPLK